MAAKSSPLVCATAMPMAAVEIRIIHTNRFFMVMLLMCDPLVSGIGDILEPESLTR